MITTTTTTTTSSSSFICEKCQSYLKIKKEREEKDNNNNNDSSTKEQEQVCTVCMNLWESDSNLLRQALDVACKAYGGIASNKFSKERTISICGEIAIRYNYYSYLQQQQQKSSTNTTTTTTTNTTTPKSFEFYLQDLKQHLNKQLLSIIQYKSEDKQATTTTPTTTTTTTTVDTYKEEQGYLSIHVLCIPPKDMKPSMYNNLNNHNKKRKQRKQRQRPFVTQGGDPRVNLETRLRQEGYSWESVAQMDLSSSSSPGNNKNKKNNNNSVMKDENPIQETTGPMEFHVAVFRKPMYLYGYYTKSRRDVSQTPFVVLKDNNNNITPPVVENHEEVSSERPPPRKKKKVAETLGVTSVEEEICGPIQNVFGISEQNNVPGSNTMYGMCKFHASGREDMDVRMLLRPNTNTIGRPFCVQLIDALRPLRSQKQLDDLVKSINHITDSTTTTTTTTTTNTTTNNNNNSNSPSNLWHGQNPMGVGISSNFKMAPAKAYSGLQADTETKVKYYGCYCWSEKELPLPSSSSSSSSKNEEKDITSSLLSHVSFPLTIQQRTPIRVLHRRANVIRERRVLQARAIYVDDHHFRLELSTEAGTYVKEFVHGDLMRTQPSISSIIGCKANLLELDCEGIQLGSEK